MATRLNRANLLAALILLLPGASVAATFFAPISTLVGPLNPPHSGGNQGVFDFGLGFSEIESVSIEIEAHVIAQERELCGFFPCVPRQELLALYAVMDTEGSPTFESVLSDELAFGDIVDDPEGFGTESAIFRNIRVGWDFLLDGEGRLTVFWNHFITLEPSRISKQPSGEIFSARIIVEGTAVPEVSTALMIGLGLLGLAIRRRRN
jgi:hypothetical protein